MDHDEARLPASGPGAEPSTSPPRSGGRSGPPPPPASPRRGWAGRLVRLLLVLGAVLLGGLLVLVAASWLLFGPPLVVEPGTWVELRFSPTYPEQKPGPGGWSAALEGRSLSAQEVAAALRRAEVDDRVTGVLLRPDGFGGGWAQAHELRERLLELRARGKRVVAWTAAPASIDYYLATAAERIHLAPEGMVWMGGLQAQLVFLRDTLSRIGVEVQAVSVGEYKSAPETFTQDASSQANRRQIMAYLDDVFEVFVADVAAGRGLTPERTRVLIDRALHDPAQALAEGLVDAHADLPSLRDELGDPPVLDPLEYLSAAGEEPGRGTVPEIALVHVTGTIVPGRSGTAGVTGEVSGHETVVERLRKAAEDEDVRAVVLRVDSPGGSALASDLVLRELRRVDRTKPVVVSMGETAASGGYYVGMDAREIWADPLTLTGSIGVFVLLPDLSGTYDKLGMRTESYLRGENADLFDPTRGLSESQRSRLQEHLDRFYVRFVERVADGRGLDVEVAEAAARGRVWSGRRALERGLVDALGGFDAAVAAAARLGGIDETVRPRIVTYQPEPDLLDQALQALFARRTSVTAAPALEAATQRLLEPVRALGSLSPALGGDVQFLLPWRLVVRSR